MTGMVYSRNGLRYSAVTVSAARKNAASSWSVSMRGRLRTGWPIHADGTTNAFSPVSWRYLPNSRTARLRPALHVPAGVSWHHAAASSRVSTLWPG